MRFDWATFAFQIVNVLALLALLRHFLFRPVAAIIAERQARTDALIAGAEAARAAAAQAGAAARAEAAEVAAQRRALLEKAQAEAEALRSEARAAARREADALLAEARDAALTLRRDAEAAATARARDLALAIAARLMQAPPGDRAVAGYAARLAAALAAMAPDARDALLDGGAARLVAPRALSEAELAEARAAFAPLGLSDPAVETDPALIAGLELRSDNGALRDSLRHDIDRIAQTLAAGGADAGRS